MFNMNARQTLSITCVALLLLSGSAPASIGVISLEELARQADLIVHASVTGIERVASERETSMGRLAISTAVVNIKPIKILKGMATEPIVVKAIENMEDSPRFREGQEVVFFLQRNEDDSSFAIVGLTQGKFDVEDGLVVREHTAVARFTAELEQLIRTQATD